MEVLVHSIHTNKGAHEINEAILVLWVCPAVTKERALTVCHYFCLILFHLYIFTDQYYLSVSVYKT